MNNFSASVPVPISYGLDVILSYTGTLDFRNKLGVDIEVGGEFIGSAEIDFSQTDTPYKLTLDIIKQYINKGPIGTGNIGMVSDNLQNVILTPYSKSRGSGTPWTNKAYGDPKTFPAVRGVNAAYYMHGDKTPLYPGGSMLFESNGGNRTLTIPGEHWSYLYYGLEPGNSGEVRGIKGEVQYWGTFNANPENDPAFITSNSFDLKGENNKFTAFLNIGKPEYPSYDVKFIKYLITEKLYSQSGDTIVKSWNLTINYSCTNSWDFRLSLVYLDNTFNWSSIPFFVKNANSFNRTSNTIEDYYYAKKDYNLKVRRTFELKSDYLTKEEMDNVLLFGITPDIKIKTTQVDAMQDARLISSSVPIVSGKNDSMYQLEIEIELSELILTP